MKKTMQKKHKQSPIHAQLALPCTGFRHGLVGELSMGRAYMAGVRARALMLHRACRLRDDDRP